jgi:hypothetical protein
MRLSRIEKEENLTAELNLIRSGNQIFRIQIPWPMKL